MHFINLQITENATHVRIEHVVDKCVTDKRQYLFFL